MLLCGGARAGDLATWSPPAEFSGAVLVARGDAVVYRAAFGFSDYAKNEPNRPETVFRIGSVTKTLTATLTLALAEKEGWPLDEPLARRWPELPEVWRALTPHLLLCHEAGLAEFTDVPGFDRAELPARAGERLVALIGERPLVFPPGTRVSYSNSNYVLLGAWLEHVEGRAYFELLQENVLGPAKMEHTAIATAGNHALGYGADAAAWTPVTERDARLLDAAGALAANVDDLWSFLRALRGGKILSAKGRERLAAARSEEFSYGWRRQSAFGRALRFQPGVVRGFSAAMVSVESEDLTVIVLSNRETQRASSIALELVERMLSPH